jgi:hypothetical protein
LYFYGVMQAFARKKIISSGAYFTLIAVYGFFCYLMLEITLQYNSFARDVAFLKIKQDYTSLAHYRIAFYVHVFSAVFVLLAGFTQFSKHIRVSYPVIHRYSGRIYVYITLLLAAPSGFIIGLYANGGLASQIAFCLLAILWWYFTWKGMTTALHRDITSHRDFMIRSFSLALSAITLRAWKYAIVAAFHPKPMDAYKIVAWLGWTLNLALAEIIIYKLQKKKQF